MKAYVSHGIGDICLEEIEKPFPRKEEVLLKVCAVRKEGWDIHPLYGESPKHFPFIPGHEFSGEVVAVGENVDTGWLHQRVGVCPIISCGDCSFCRKGKIELCINCKYLGFEKNGGFSEFAIVPAKNLLLLPKSVSYEEAVMLEPLAAAIHAVRKTAPESNDKVIVCGMDRMGILLWMCLKDAGVKNIYVIGNGEVQEQMAEKIGVPYQNFGKVPSVNLVEWVSRCTKGKGADILYECTGENRWFKQIVNMMAPMGKICLIGKPHSDIELKKEIYEIIRRNHLTLEGSLNSFFNGMPEDDWHYALERLEKRKIVLEPLVFMELKNIWRIERISAS